MSVDSFRLEFNDVAQFLLPLAIKMSREQVGSEVEFTAFLNAKGNPQGFNLRDPSWGKRARKG